MELEILENGMPGYHPLMRYEGWRVAVANACEKWVDGQIAYLERHMETDEVFVLLEGSGALYIGAEARKVPMEIGKVYNVKKATWHNMALASDAKVLIVENDNTGRDNTEYRDFQVN